MENNENKRKRDCLEVSKKTKNKKYKFDLPSPNNEKKKKMIQKITKLNIDNHFNNNNNSGNIPLEIKQPSEDNNHNNNKVEEKEEKIKMTNETEITTDLNNKNFYIIKITKNCQQNNQPIKTKIVSAPAGLVLHTFIESIARLFRKGDDCHLYRIEIPIGFSIVSSLNREQPIDDEEDRDGKEIRFGDEFKISEIGFYQEGQIMYLIYDPYSSSDYFILNLMEIRKYNGVESFDDISIIS